MFESLREPQFRIERASYADVVFWVLPPAISLVCTIAFALGVRLQVDRLIESALWGCLLGMLTAAVALSLYYLSTGDSRRAMQVWIYSLGVATLAVPLGYFLLLYFGGFC